MTSDGLRVDHDGLDQAALDLQAAVRRIAARMDALEGELEPLRSEWSGQAQQAYVRAKGVWDAALQEMTGLLADTGRAVAWSNQDYRAADQRAASSFGG
jgi:early secretory antigenic target protein ESAT-6